VRDVSIIGSGQTPINKDAGVRGRHLSAKAIRDAIAAAGIEKSRVDALFVGNMTAGILGHQQQLGSLVADYAGLDGIEATNIEAACASGAAALRIAYMTIAGGINDVVVVCGVERMTHADRDAVTRALATAADWELEGRRGESFPSLNAQLMRAYMAKYGVGAEGFAPFSILAHANAMTNANALFHKRIGMEQYLESRMIADPIRLFDVSPVCNGAAAVVLAAADLARRLDPNAPRVLIAASTAATAPLALARRRDALKLEAVESSTERALEMAGIRHGDVDFFELHDAYTIMSVLTLESAGFAEAGAATHLAAEGRYDLGGELPISTLGGLKARGHPVGATGVYQAVEAYLQLTGRSGSNQIEGAETALLQNIGGTASTVVSHVVRRAG
jgi:acetyl-CoA C-acetyltransferase